MKKQVRTIFALLLIMLASAAYAQSNRYHVVTKGETLYRISKIYDVEIEEIKKLNPECKKGLEVGQKLVIPQSKNNGKSEGAVYHTVQKKETLYRISKMYNVSQDEIKRLNPGCGKGLSIGQKLLIKEGRKKSAPAPGQNPEYIYHTVQKKETLYRISKMYNVSQDEIKRLNPGCEKGLSVGQKLKIKKKGNTRESVSENGGNSKKHTIKRNETLYSISKKYGVSQEAIKAANPGLSASNFCVGETIVIPSPDSNGKSEDTPGKESVKTETPNTNKELIIGGKNATAQKDTIKIVRTHKVKKNETIESICLKYGVSREDFMRVNPTLRVKPIKRRMRVNIPEKRKIQVEEKKPAADSTDYEEIFSNINEIKNKKKDFDGVTDVAIILPFLLDRYTPDIQARMVEYYEGFLMAVEKLKEQGCSFTINVYDSGSKENSLDSLISSRALDEMDIIFGAYYDNHCRELIEYSNSRQTALVIPFSRNLKYVKENPFANIVLTDKNIETEETTSNFVKFFPNANVIFVQDTILSSNPKFKESLISKFAETNITYGTVDISRLTDEETAASTLKALKVDGAENIIIPESSSRATFSTLIPALAEAYYTDSTSMSGYKVFGYPEWQIYAKDASESMYVLDTYFYTTLYSHYSLKENAQFEKEFYHWYKRTLFNYFPRYGMLGYDTAYHFLYTMSKHGYGMQGALNTVEFTPLQMGFKFEKAGENGGCYNRKVSFIHYTPEMTIERIDPESEKIIVE